MASSAAAQPIAQPLPILAVPFLSQSEALCGGAAAAMVLRYWGERGLTAETFSHLVDRSAAGIRTSALVNELLGRGWNATGIKGTDGAIANELARGRPVIALIEDRPGTFHYIVIVAATARAVVFHDPARAPMRVMTVEEFARRWEAADRWMAVILPGDRAPVADAPPPGTPPAETPCDDLVAAGVSQARSNDLTAAERSLAAALSCPGAAAARELAGVRLLQRRWPDVEALSAAALAADPRDAQAWRLLGASRYVQDDAAGALDAWNHVGEPRIDLIRVDGLVRSRQRGIERLLGVRTGEMLSAETMVTARRRLELLPAAASTRLTYVPVPSGLAELHAVVNERALVPSGAWSYAALAAAAAARRELEISLGAPTGGGDVLTASWRFWSNRPAGRLVLAAPAPWGGIWSVQGTWEREAFDAGLAATERRGVQLSAGNWLASVLQVQGRLGAERWEDSGAYLRAGLTTVLRSRSGGLEARAAADRWMGDSAFSSVEAAVRARSRTNRVGFVVIATGGLSAISTGAPMDTWFAGDTGDTRSVLLRAHPAVADGRLQAARMGRRLLFATTETQHWWSLSALRVAGAVFADAARTGLRLVGPARTDVDLGAGLRVAAPGVPGTFRIDVAKGLRDGATTASFVYDALGW